LRTNDFRWRSSCGATGFLLKEIPASVILTFFPLLFVDRSWAIYQGLASAFLLMAALPWTVLAHFFLPFLLYPEILGFLLLAFST